MTDARSLCADLDITVIACNEAPGANRTAAVNILQRMLDTHGDGHVILVLRTIAESEGNSAMLIAPVILAVSDIVLAHPAWAATGLRWIEAFDTIRLKDLMDTARLNRKACPLRPAIAAMLYTRLCEVFPSKTIHRRPQNPSSMPSHSEDRPIC